MKYFRRALLLIFVIIMAVTFLGCNRSDIFKKDYAYSHNGFKEIEEFFSEIEPEKFNGKISYMIKADKSSPNYIDYYVKPAVGNTSAITVAKYRYLTDNFAFYSNAEKNYLIDYNDKLVSEKMADIMKGYGVMMLISTFGYINLKKDGELVYQFINKKEATIKDHNNKEVKTIEYVYACIDEDETENKDVKLRVNFDKKERKIVRYNFESYDEAKDQTSIKSVYIIDISKTVDQSIFQIPGGDEGFTVVNDEDDED